GFAIGRSEFEIGAKMRTAVLNSIADRTKILDAVIERNDPSDFLAHLPTGLAAEQLGPLRIGCGSDFPQNSPFSSCFANLARNFGGEHDTPLCAGFGASIVLFVTRFGGQ